MRWMWFLGLLVSWAMPAWALICVSPTLVGVGATQTFTGSGSGYNPFDTAEYVQTVNFSVAMGSVGTCNYFVVLGAGQSGNGALRELRKAPNSLVYGVYTTSAKTYTLLPLATATSNHVLSGSFATGLNQSRSHSFVWTITPPQPSAYATGNYYTDSNVSLDLYEGTVAGAKTLVNSVPIIFRTLVVRSFDLAVVGSGGAFAIGSTSQNVAFGSAVSGDIRDFDIIVRSSDGYRLTLQSANQQKLKHTLAAVATTLPYTVQVSNVAYDLSGGGAVTVGTLNAATPIAGTRLPVRVTLGTLTGSEVAGTYSDTLTATVSAY